MNDDEAAVVPLGRRLESLARLRLRAWEPRPAWLVPLAVALRRVEEVADVLGARFERTEVPPRPTAQFPAPQTWAQPAPRFVPRTTPPPGAPDRPAQRPGPPDSDLRPLPDDVRSRLRREVGRAADVMRVHDGPRANARARAADADAVTVGPDVYLRQGRWMPRREEGLALLAHEATHVAALVDPGSAWRRVMGQDAEEALAQARERYLLGAARAPAPSVPVAVPASPAVLPGLTAPSASPRGYVVPTAVPAPSSPASSAPADGTPPAAVVPSAGMRADVDRDLAPPTAAPDLEALRRSLIADVLQRVRSEIERGA